MSNSMRHVVKGLCLGLVLGQITFTTNLLLAQMREREEHASLMALNGTAVNLYDLSDGCPHAAFIMKHVCTWCLTDGDALKFSEERNRISATNVNTVVMGDPSFKRNDAGFCENEERVKVMTCTMSQRSCRLDGTACKTFHDLGNGHMYYRDTQC